MPTPALPESLPAKLYLLACDPANNRLANARDLGYLLRGAALAELSLRYCLRDVGGRVAVAGSKRTKDPVLDELLREIAEAPPKSWRAWVRWGGKATVRAVEAQLSTAGLIQVREQRLFGLFPVRRIALEVPEVFDELKAAAHAVLVGTGPVTKVEQADAALIAVAAAGALHSAVSRKEQRDYGARIKELTERSGNPLLIRVLRQVRAAKSATYGYPAGT